MLTSYPPFPLANVVSRDRNYDTMVRTPRNLKRQQKLERIYRKGVHGCDSPISQI